MGHPGVSSFTGCSSISTDLTSLGPTCLIAYISACLSQSKPLNVQRLRWGGRKPSSLSGSNVLYAPGNSRYMSSLIVHKVMHDLHQPMCVCVCARASLCTFAYDIIYIYVHMYMTYIYIDMHTHTYAYMNRLHTFTIRHLMLKCKRSLLCCLKYPKMQSSCYFGTCRHPTYR